MVLLIAFLATVRLMIALLLDFQRPQWNAAELLTDTSLFLLFGSMLALGLRRANFPSIHPAWGVVLIILLGLNFLQFGGVLGVSRFNYYCGLFVIILLYNQRHLAILLAFQLSFIVALTASTALELPWTKIFFLDFQPDTIDFLFALLALGLLSYYLKGITLLEVEKAQLSNERIRQQVGEAKKMNRLLVQKGKELLGAQQHLEEEVHARAHQLEEKQRAIEKFIHLNTRVLQEPVEELNRSLDQIQTSDPMQAMLLVSVHELNDVFGGIKRTLDASEQLDRKKLSS